MPAERFFTEGLFIEGHSAFLEEGEFHHLCHVMRAKVGAPVELVNGKGQLALAVLEKVEKRSASLLVKNVRSFSQKSHKVILAQAIPRFNRLEFILEKGTELGACEFWLFPGMYSEKEEFSSNQEHRMQQILIAAMKQCGRLDLPQILHKTTLFSWAPQDADMFYGDTRDTAPLFSDVYSPLKECTIFFIGPEKGFHEKEIAFFDSVLQAKGVKLHENILRVDTAPLVALSLLHSRLFSMNASN